MSALSDLALVFRDMYLKHCADFVAVGVPVPTPVEWVDLIDACLQEKAGDDIRY